MSKANIAVVVLLVLVGGCDSGTPSKQKSDQSPEAFSKQRESPTSDYDYIQRGLNHAAQRRYHDAIAEYTKAIELNPNNFYAYVYRGGAFADVKEYYRAQSDLNAAVELIKVDPKFALVYQKKGDVSIATNEYDAAIREYTKAIKIDPDSSLAYYGRGRAYAAKKDFDSAILEFSTMIRIGVYEDLGFSSRADAYAGKKDFTLAVADLSRIIEHDPKNADGYRDRGRMHERAEQFQAAIADYSRALELDPTAAWIYGSRADAHKRVASYDAAISDYSKAIELDKELAWVWYSGRAEAFRTKGDIVNAIADYTRVIEKSQDDSSAFVGRGDCFILNNEKDKGMLDYKQAVDILTATINKDDKDWESLSDRADAFEKLGNTELMRADHEKVLTLLTEPKEAYEYHWKAWSLFKLGRLNEALADTTLSLELEPGDADTLEVKGQILESLGKHEEAISVYKTAAQKKPTLTISREALERLTSPDNSRVDHSKSDVRP